VKKEIVQLGQNDAFAAYRLPREKDYVLLQQYGFKQQSGLQMDLPEPGFLIYPFIVSEKHPYLSIRPDKVLINPEFEFHPANKLHLTSTSKVEYLENAALFISATKEGFDKLVLSRIEVIEQEPGSVFKLFSDLCSQYADAFVYLYNHPSCGTWMGASPEIFLKKEAGAWETISLAGTRKVNDKNGKISPWSKKEYEEQGLVTNFIRRTLEQKKIVYEYEGPVEHKAGKLVHLKTTFKFNLGDALLPGLLMGLHPTPAVCGIPKEQALSFIAGNEKHERAYYTGFTGPVGIMGKTALYVNLRCMQISSNQIVLYLGGGITAASNAEAEWQETVDKSTTLKAVIINN
jgi:isochorismate synthase